MRVTQQSELKRQSRSTLRIALALSVLFHAVLFVVVPPTSTSAYRSPTEDVVESMWDPRVVPPPPPKREPERRFGELPAETVIEPEIDDLEREFEPEPSLTAPEPPPPPGSSASSSNAEAELSVYVEPDYPSVARAAGIEGEVVLRVRVDDAGRVVEIELVSTDSGDLFTEAAQRAVREWRFHPAVRNGSPVASWVIVPLRFRLR